MSTVVLRAGAWVVLMVVWKGSSMVVMRVFAKAEQKEIEMAVLLANRQADLKAVQMEYLTVAGK